MKNAIDCQNTTNKRVIKLKGPGKVEGYIESFSYSQGFFDYSTTPDILKSLDLKDGDFDFCVKCLSFEKIDFVVEKYTIKVEKLG